MASAEPPPFWVDIRLDGIALLCLFGACLFATVAAGLAPALQAARANTQDILKDESRGASSFRMGRLSRVIVIAEMALSLALLVGAGLTIKGVVRLYTVDLGFDANRVFTTRIMLPDSGYPDAQAKLRFANQLMDRVRAISGVRSATLATAVPGMSASGVPVVIEGRANDADSRPPMTSLTNIQDGYFAALGIPLVQGREFNALDIAGALPVAIINRAFERRHFPGGAALGQRIMVRTSPTDSSWLTIVGTVPDMYPAGLENTAQDAVYQPLAQTTPRRVVLLAGAPGDAAALLPAVRDIVTALDPELPLEDTGSVSDVIRRENWFYAVFGTLFAAFGFAALFVATVGLYGVMAFSVSQRRREMGVRKAVGATGRDIVRLIMRQGFLHAAIGMVLGLGLAFAASRLLQAVLFQVEPDDPWIFGSVSIVLAATVLLACWIPARRAARADPLEALRTD